MEANKEIIDTIKQIDIEVANTKDIISKASLIASKVKLLELLNNNQRAGKRKLKRNRNKFGRLKTILYNCLI